MKCECANTSPPVKCTACVLRRAGEILEVEKARVLVKRDDRMTPHAVLPGEVYEARNTEPATVLDA